MKPPRCQMAAVFAVAVLAGGPGCFREPPPYPSTSRVVALIAARLDEMDEVAKVKWNARRELRDADREREQIEELLGAAVDYDLPPEVVTAFFTAQFEAGKLAQERALERWKSQNRGPFRDAQNLAFDIRPRIDLLNRMLLAALAEYRAGPQAPAGAIRYAADTYLRHVPEDVRATALKPLLGK